MTGESRSPTMRQLAERGGHLAIYCAGGRPADGCCPIHTIGGALASERWGGDKTAAALAKGLRCLACRAGVRIDVIFPQPAYGHIPQQAPFTGVTTCWGDPWKPVFETWTDWERLNGRGRPDLDAFQPNGDGPLEGEDLVARKTRA